ncbi:hypothetical protein PVAP13_2KG302302 [Panicum virgatum]|uniref:Uncharacterized protein n=1 Tax=Panicum virgatum TaxID=38727 RepID=A0A8T0WA61_PANVG|nr:hypothetical protein PVAP13_2KG302302 [Panicum virgatum]
MYSPSNPHRQARARPTTIDHPLMIRIKGTQSSRIQHLRRGRDPPRQRSAKIGTPGGSSRDKARQYRRAHLLVGGARAGVLRAPLPALGRSSPAASGEDAGGETARGRGAGRARARKPRAEREMRRAQAARVGGRNRRETAAGGGWQVKRRGPRVPAADRHVPGRGRAGEWDAKSHHQPGRPGRIASPVGSSRTR